jgi:prepilin peptidase CpaA
MGGTLSVNWVAALDVVLQLAFLICVSFAVITDFRTLLIPNWISLALLAAFAPFAVLHLPLGAIGGHVLVMAIVFALTAFFFVVGWMGGGDVKLMSAVALWMGPGHVAPFVVLMALLGGMLAISLMAMEKFGRWLDPGVFNLALFRRLGELADGRQCPYGVAIGVAGFIVSFDLFTSVGEAR